MPKYKGTCNYCGNTWVSHYYSTGQMEYVKCEKCKDSSIKFSLVDEENNDPFGYFYTKPLDKKIILE